MPTAIARRTAAQLFMIGLPGPELDDDTAAFLQDYPAGGFVLFKRNIRSAAQLRRLVARLHATGCGVRPLVAIDHEGGRVHRTPAPFTHFPPAATVAAGGPATARAVGRAMGRELAAVGIDLDFAPVLDVWTNPRNVVIGDRAFGTTPGPVARLALAQAEGLLAGGVLPCGKHFPGHGGTTGDSHFVLPRVHRSRRDLAAVDLVPFVRAIAARFPALMTAHVVYRALDPRRPATLSRRICHDLLRRQLRFRGTLFSDDLDMHAVAGRTTPAQRALRALQAGCDMLLACQRLDVARAAIDGIAEAIVRGRVDGPRIADALHHIQALRARLPRRPPPAGLPRRGWPTHARLARRLAAHPA